MRASAGPQFQIDVSIELAVVPLLRRDDATSPLRRAGRQPRQPPCRGGVARAAGGTRQGCQRWPRVREAHLTRLLCPPRQRVRVRAEPHRCVRSCAGSCKARVVATAASGFEPRASLGASGVPAIAERLRTCAAFCTSRRRVSTRAQLTHVAATILPSPPLRLPARCRGGWVLRQRVRRAAAHAVALLPGLCVRRAGAPLARQAAHGCATLTLLVVCRMAASPASSTSAPCLAPCWTW